MIIVKMKFRVELIMLLTALLSFHACASNSERRLMEKLFKTYNPDVRPVHNTSETIVVEVQQTIMRIFKVDERQELFTTSGWCSLIWDDVYLKWNPDDYNGQTTINVSPEKVWIPDIVLYDDFSTDKGFGSHIHKLQSRLIIMNTGRIEWGLRLTFISKCHYDIHYFPFDFQTCPFRYGSLSYAKGKVDISPQSMISVEHVSRHMGWRLLGSDSKLLRKDYRNGVYESVEFSITVQRSALFRWLHLLLPPLILEILVLLSFVLPADSGERLALSVTLLLAMIFFIVSVTNLIPTDDASTPIIYQLFIVTLIEISILIIVIILSMQLYHKKPYDPPMPHWIKSNLYDKLSYWIGIRVDPVEYIEKDDILNPNNNDDAESAIEVGFLSGDSCSSECGNMAVLGGCRLVRCICMTRQHDERILREWRVVALTIDRCLFLIFLLTFIVTITSFWLHAVLK